MVHFKLSNYDLNVGKIVNRRCHSEAHAPNPHFHSTPDASKRSISAIFMSTYARDPKISFVLRINCVKFRHVFSLFSFHNMMGKLQLNSTNIRSDNLGIKGRTQH
uniref:ORF31 n=1 Tax=Malaco herpesvirus 4 TaxID=3031800 RepID=A0AA48SEZ9_9VIRU|nr:TPA_asm: ORF31 [Malaco herpesvirus 4]